MAIGSGDGSLVKSSGMCEAGEELLLQMMKDNMGIKMENQDDVKPDDKPVDDKPVDKPVNDKPVDKKDDKPVDDKPVENKIDLKLSDGSLLSKEDLDRVSGYALKKGLTQEEAVELLSAEETVAKKALESFEKKQEEMLETEHKKWIEVGMSDPELVAISTRSRLSWQKSFLDKFGHKRIKRRS